MKLLNYTTVLLLFAAPIVHATDADVLLNKLNKAQKLLESGKTLKEGDLTNLLVRHLGVTPEQAAGGAGALLQIAQAHMSPDEFTQLSKQVPDVKYLLGAVPTPIPQSGLGGLAGKLASFSGDNSISAALTAVSIFQQLGMKPETMQKFVPVIIDYVKGDTGSAIAGSLSAALASQKK